MNNLEIFYSRFIFIIFLTGIHFSCSAGNLSLMKSKVWPWDKGNDCLLNKLLIVQKILLISTLGNVQRTL